ncbi:MAG: cell division protein FtsA [Rickettsiales bacterium]|nr:cell division protein FtsA [Rickettsiales bacterium]
MIEQDAIRNLPGSIAALDIGTTKIACFIAQIDDNGAMRILGVGHQLARGIKSGLITDVSEAETSIVAAVHAAEQMAGETIENVVVSIGGRHVRSRNVSVELDVAGDAVGDSEIIDIIRDGSESLSDDEHEIMHIFPVQYALDDAKGLRDPRGMVGERLGAELHVVMARRNYLSNLTNCIARCHLNVSEYVLSPHASALAALDQDEMELGVTLIEMGGGTTSVSVFTGGKNVFSTSVPVGGQHVTSDIANGLSTSISHAERIKILHGSAISQASDEDRMIEVPQLGEEEDEDDPHRVPRTMLVGVIRPRMEEIFEMVRAKLEEAGVDKVAGRRCVLTGGASQLVGVDEMAGRILSKQVRRGKPVPLPGLADAVTGPAFATVAGMIEYVTKRAWEADLLASRRRKRGFSLTREKLVTWLKENF